MRKIYRKIKHKIDLLGSKISWKNNKNTYKSIAWYLLLIYIGTVLYFIQRIFILSSSDFEKVLSLLISTIGITVAIIISFLFSKLYSEKNERIERKRSIDLLSKKVTALRKIVFHLRGSHDFWNHYNRNIKHYLDSKYKNLTLYGYDQLEYNKLRAFHEEVGFGELETQGYLGLKEIEGKVRSTYVFFDRLYRKNYSLRELSIIQDSCQRMWSFMDHHPGEFRDVRTLPQLDTEPIKDNLKIIYPDLNFDDFDNKRLKKLFDDFADGYIRQQYYLTQRNSVSFGKSFNSLLFDLVAFVLLIICGILILSINLTDDIKLNITNIIVAIFSATVIDLLANVILSIRKELDVIDFYET